MKKDKYYFEFTDSENCYTVDHFYEQLKENDLPQMQIYPAIIEHGTDYFWCSEFGEIGETGESCGKCCDRYKPRNGKNGRCVYHKNCYTASEISITIYKK
jgi:methionyl-tRNA synthetase